MAESRLLNASGNDRIDQLLPPIIRIVEQHCPERVRGYYLVGSYAVGEAVPTSDIDLIVLFKGELSDDDRQQFAVAREQCRAVTPLALDLTAESEAKFFRVGGVWFQTASVLLYGQDVRGAIPRKPIGDHIRDSMHAVLPLLARVRGTPPTLRFPLDYPDPTDEFYGYTQRLLRLPDGSTQHCTKNLVLNVISAAGGLALLAAGQYEGSGKKRDIVTQYRRHVGDEWSELVAQVFDACRDRWSYLIPTAAAERAELRALAAATLGFENHFLLRYKDYLLQELRGSDQLGRGFALRRLGQIIYPDAELRGALEQLTQQADSALREAATTALQLYREPGGQAEHPG